MIRLLTTALFLATLTVARAEDVLTRVMLSSHPSGAAVTVDGRDRGTTPVTLYDLAPGRHHVKFRLAGYVERDRFVTAREHASVDCSEALEEERGLLLIKTDPPGCDIRIDGVSVGKSPRLFTNLAVKDTYAVRLVKAGYQDQSISVRFDGGRRPVVREEKLVLDSGVINITSDPPGADVTVNGVPRGKSPVLVRDIPRGRATVRFRMEGFREETRELAMRPGEQQNLPIILTPLPGTLHLVSEPAGARFYVNDEPRGVAPLVIPGLKPGDYDVRAEKDGYGTLSRTVTIANGQAAREEFRLSNVMGRLEVRTDPVGASVFLDGRLVGMTKSRDPNAATSDTLAIENLLEGEHTLVVRSEGYAEATRHPIVKNSKTVQANVRLRRIFIPNTEIITARGTHRGVLVSITPETVVLEVSPGITQSFNRSEIRKTVDLKATP